MNRWCLAMNANESKKPPCSRRETPVSKHENMFTPVIIWMEETLWRLKSSPCQLDVKLSKPMYPARRITPDIVVTVPLCLVTSPLFNKNNVTPTEIMQAVMYSWYSYVLFDTTFPINITGMTLDALAKTCVGKLTNLRASYWHQLLMMFENELNE